jgi:hypothetical protein
MRRAVLFRQAALDIDVSPDLNGMIGFKRRGKKACKQINGCSLWAVLQAALHVLHGFGGWTNLLKSYYSIADRTFPSPIADFHTMWVPL